MRLARELHITAVLLQEPVSHFTHVFAAAIPTFCPQFILWSGLRAQQMDSSAT